MKSEQVYQSIRQFIYNHDFKLENVYVHAWEADLFSVTASKYCYEIEVKVSRSDFFADMRKPKHELLKTLDLNHKKAPNKFFYAVPVGLVDEFEVPKYAGLIYVMDSGEWRIIRKAPFLHRDEFNHRVMLFDKYYYQWANMKNKFNDLEDEISFLKKELEHSKNNIKV